MPPGFHFSQGMNLCQGRGGQGTKRLKQQHAQALLTVLLRGMCALRDVDLQLEERSELGAVELL